MGNLGALVMRALFILVGITLIQKFHWVIYIMGGFLIITGIKMATQKDADINPERNPVLRLIRRFVRVTEDYEGGRFFVRRSGRLLATPLFIVVLVVETTDVIFAVDSIPPSSPSRWTPSSYIPRTSLPSWGSVRCTSPWPGSCSSSITCPMACRSSWCLWDQDAAGGYLQNPNRHGIGNGRWCTGDLGGCLILFPPKPEGTPTEPDPHPARDH